MSGSPCSSPPFSVKPQGAPPLSWTWMWWKETSCSTVSMLSRRPVPVLSPSPSCRYRASGAASTPTAENFGETNSNGGEVTGENIPPMSRDSRQRASNEKRGRGRGDQRNNRCIVVGQTKNHTVTERPAGRGL
ncbi:hypothetical protein EYF80_047922 [Liparis tanakae]|uniref:Uncharacterized protein n=1 Tax=Liparis tanakae TaxID=230148 RepID=A0A4Z2FKZ5_9TELE|nr:hypothetical protein EYF80_047922 [Liparis tanakae]